MKNRKIISTIGILVVAFIPATIFHFLKIDDLTSNVICIFTGCMAGSGISAIWE